MKENQLLKHCPFCKSSLTYAENTLYCNNDQCDGIFKKVGYDLPYWETTVGIDNLYSFPLEDERELYCYYRDREEMLSEIRNKIYTAFSDPDVLVRRYEEHEFSERNGYGVTVSIRSNINFEVRDYDKTII
ncbi:MAG: hypothetical protein OSJ43_11525 [Oscillospiraceae bacterium]|nr:hypothetical protein [Oscillospiraceae bacterium]